MRKALHLVADVANANDNLNTELREVRVRVVAAERKISATIEESLSDIRASDVTTDPSESSSSNVSSRLGMDKELNTALQAEVDKADTLVRRLDTAVRKAEAAEVVTIEVREARAADVTDGSSSELSSDTSSFSSIDDWSVIESLKSGIKAHDLQPRPRAEEKDPDRERKIDFLKTFRGQQARQRRAASRSSLSESEDAIPPGNPFGLQWKFKDSFREGLGDSITVFRGM